jgi:hypothetical protein
VFSVRCGPQRGARHQDILTDHLKSKLNKSPIQASPLPEGLAGTAWEPSKLPNYVSITPPLQNGIVSHYLTNFLLSLSRTTSLGGRRRRRRKKNSARCLHVLREIGDGTHTHTHNAYYRCGTVHIESRSGFEPQ